ncbi:MAG: hypothetical protein JO356_18990 [Acidobacteria bacterium]|nr:hypothetical protein [Acidobacteriota bacterium]
MGKLTIKHRIPIKVVKQERQLESLKPGEQATGIVSLEMWPHSQPTVFSFAFVAGNTSPGQFRKAQEVTVYLVR